MPCRGSGVETIQMCCCCSSAGWLGDMRASTHGKGRIGSKMRVPQRLSRKVLATLIKGRRNYHQTKVQGITDESLFGYHGRSVARYCARLAFCFWVLLWQLRAISGNCSKKCTTGMAETTRNVHMPTGQILQAYWIDPLLHLSAHWPGNNL